MKNWNDAGTVHFDQSTDEMPVVRVLAFRCLGVALKLQLKIPMTIYKRLNSADWDEALAFSRKTFPEICCKLIAVNVPIRPTDELARDAELQLKKSVCELLYNKFLMRQAVAGDMVWAVPRTMEDVGPPPEEDDRYLVGNGVIQ